MAENGNCKEIIEVIFVENDVKDTEIFGAFNEIARLKNIEGI